MLKILYIEIHDIFIIVSVKVKSFARKEHFMNIIDAMYRNDRELFIALSGFFWGFHLNQVGIEKWDKGGIEDFRGDFLNDGDLLVANHYENGETFYYFVQYDEIGWFSEKDLDEDPDFQAFVKQKKNK